MTRYISLFLMLIVWACSSGGSSVVDPPDPEPVTLADTVTVTLTQEESEYCVTTPWAGLDAVYFGGKWVNYLTNASESDRFYGRVDYWDATRPVGSWESFNSGSVADSIWTIAYCVNVEATISYSLRATGFTVERIRGDTTFLPDSAVVQWDHVVTSSPAERGVSNGTDRQAGIAILLGHSGEVGPSIR